MRLTSVAPGSSGAGEVFFRDRKATDPLSEVTWQECRDWCARHGLRLPRIDEWEYAARGPGGRGSASFGLEALNRGLWEWCEEVWAPAESDGPRWRLPRRSGDRNLRVIRWRRLHDGPGFEEAVYLDGFHAGGRDRRIGLRPAANLPE